MAKKGMKRPELSYKKPHSEAKSVPIIQGKAKSAKEHANPIIAGTKPPSQKVYHTVPFSSDKPISPVYSTIDNDLARDNLENNITAADLQDL